ncbi:MAG: class I tRNA ligase family protein, partial [Planctomycetes bacterium]|nr:class I tRNA ligase family protein [Planctomycetota bacterium]
NTMPQWAGSCWYYLRYLDPRGTDAPWDREKERYWMPVDLYIGGAEHAVLHLLYARFWHKVLYDLGIVSTNEPFRKLVNQGLILGEDGEKMSKSRGNVINPDDIIESYGADAMRLYEMFMGPLERVKPWSTNGLEGVYRFIRRAWGLIVGEGDGAREDLRPEPPEGDEARILHKTIKAVTDDIESLRFNTAIARLMEFVNAEMKVDRPSKPALETFVLLLSPFAPHVCEELWEKLGHGTTLAYEPWPDHDPERIRDEVVTLPIQIDGKLRDRIDVAIEIGEEELRERVLARERVRAILGDRPPRRFLYVPRRLVNIVR